MQTGRSTPSHVSLAQPQVAGVTYGPLVDSLGPLIVRYYAQAVAFAEWFNIGEQPVTHARRRLTAMVGLIGEDKFAGYLGTTTDPRDLSQRLHYIRGM